MALRLAVVGLAGMGGTHVRLTARLDEYELVAVCDVVREPLERAAAATGAKPFTSVDGLLASGVAEAVVIATPPSLHLEHVRAALEAGVHVYCEKPVVATIEQADELARIARASGLCVQVGFQHRFQHSFATARTLIHDGAIGDVYRANLTSTSWFRPQAYFDARPWRGRWSDAGGGVLMNQAIHHVDAFLWLVGMPSLVTAKAHRVRHRVDVEDDAIALLEFPNGGRGVVTASTIDPLGMDRLEVHGELGSLVSQGQRLRHARLTEPAQSIADTCPDAFPQIAAAWEEVPPEGKPTTFVDFVVACHRDFVDAIAQGRDPRNHPEEASKAVELANAVYLSAVSGESVPLPLDRAAYRDVFERLCDGRATLPG